MAPTYKNFIYNAERGFLFAYVPKVACTNWKSLLRYMAGQENWLNSGLAHDKQNGGLHYLDLDSPEADLLQDPSIRKYAMVRNPYSRVLSAYLNKVESRLPVTPEPVPGENHFTMVTREIDRYRREELNTAKYPDVSFEVFLLWLRDSGSWFTHDEHWAPQVSLLRYPDVKYSVLGRFENLATDAAQMLYEMGCDQGFPSQKDVKFQPTNAKSKIDLYFDDACYDLVNQVFHEDFLAFSYPMKGRIDRPSQAQADKAPPLQIVEFQNRGHTATGYRFGPGEHVITEPLLLDTFDFIEGAGKDATVLKVTGTFPGPVIATKRLLENCRTKPWFFEDGVPAKFRIENLTVDLSEWTPEHQHDYAFEHDNVWDAAVGLYGKGFTIKELNILNCPASGLVSIGSSKGGKRDLFFDSPEATISDVHITNTKKHGCLFAGPHDTYLDRMFISHTKGKGLYVMSAPGVNGACDIGFVHAYATDDVAIQIDAKIKANFLQGDTGRYAGVIVNASNKSLIGHIESFKVRGSRSDYSVVISSSETQISTVRIRADAGASGLLLSGFGNVISSLNINAGEVHPDFAGLNIQHFPQPIMVTGNQNTIVHARVADARHFPIATEESNPARFFTANLEWNATYCPDASDEELMRKLHKPEIKTVRYG